MTVSSYNLTRIAHHSAQLAMVLVLLVSVFDANASHELTVNPSLPTSENTISILATGEWYSGGGPSLDQWSLDGQNIRIFTTGIIPGIPQPLVPYQLNVDIGRLPPGQYHVDYYIEVLAAPGIPSAMATSPAAPDASLSFKVLATPAPIPALSASALILLGVLLMFTSLLAPGGFFRFSSLRL